MVWHWSVSDILQSFFRRVDNVFPEQTLLFIPGEGMGSAQSRIIKSNY